MKETIMSTIKTTYNNIEEVPAGMESIYVKNDETGTFDLPQVEGLVAKDKLSEFRENNINLRKEIEGFTTAAESQAMAMDKMRAEIAAMEAKYSGVDLEAIAAQDAEMKALAEKQMIEAGDVDTLINQRVEEVLAAKQKELELQATEFKAHISGLESDLVSYDTQLNTMLVDNELTKIAGNLGVRASALEDVLSRGRAVFRVENGKATAFGKEGRPVYMEDAVTPLSIDGWIEGLTKSAPHLFEMSTGAGMAQPTATTAPAEVVATPHDSILAGLASLNTK